MKSIFIFIHLLFSFFVLSAQTSAIDNLTGRLPNKSKELIYLDSLFQRVIYYIDINLDSSLLLVQQFNQIPSKPKSYQLNGFDIMGDIYLRLGDPSKSFESLLKALRIEETSDDTASKAMLYWNLGKLYYNQNENSNAISYFLKGAAISHAAHQAGPESKALAELGVVYLDSRRFDSALHYTRSAYQAAQQGGYKSDLPKLLIQFGNICYARGDVNIALDYYRMALREAKGVDLTALSESSVAIARLLKENHHLDSCYYYAKQGYLTAKKLHNMPILLKASTFLKQYFVEKEEPDSAFTYQGIEMAIKDSTLNLEKIKKVQIIAFEELQRVKDLETQKREYQSNLKLYTLVISLVTVLGIAFFLFRNNKRKQRTNVLLRAQKQEIENQKNTVERTLQELRSTQAQLIQSEKMASLGELTAGIAHEIQNPLNFVNNFSEVNGELIKELRREASTGNMEEVNAIANDIEANSEKINHHGKRADAIVKGMLQHSRTGSGAKEPTDINKLSDEYLRLSYQGFRARDKSFDATFSTEFDNAIGNMNVVHQEISRVLLNLINNAFYAVNEKARLQSASGGYKPLVIIQTKNLNDKIEIVVKDNGNGIPKQVKEKIFQPFFTTKPPGQGTGLGLSLAYDIVKAHGGEIKVNSTEGEGSEFIVGLPI